MGPLTVPASLAVPASSARPWVSLLELLRRLLAGEDRARAATDTKWLRRTPPLQVDTSDDTSLTQAELDVLQ